jgi:hypothetical protein
MKSEKEMQTLSSNPPKFWVSEESEANDSKEIMHNKGISIFL